MSWVFRSILLGLTVGFCPPGFAKKKSSRLECSAHHLEVKSCLLEGLGLKVQVTESKISLFDGVWRQLEDFPYPGENREWKVVRLRALGERKFLELKIWDRPVGPTEIQSLLWAGYEVKDLSLIKKWQEVIQKRSRIQGENSSPERARGQFEEKKPPRYLYDKMEKHRLSLDKDGRLVWYVGEAKRLERGSKK